MISTNKSTDQTQLLADGLTHWIKVEDFTWEMWGVLPFIAPIGYAAWVRNEGNKITQLLAFMRLICFSFCFPEGWWVICPLILWHVYFTFHPAAKKRSPASAPESIEVDMKLIWKVHLIFFFSALSDKKCYPPMRFYCGAFSVSSPFFFFLAALNHMWLHTKTHHLQ